MRDWEEKDSVNDLLSYTWIQNTDYVYTYTVQHSDLVYNYTLLICCNNNFVVAMPLMTI